MNAIREFLRLESASGILLIGSLVLALLCANTPLVGIYDALLDTPVAVQVGALSLAKPLLLWINDGLMAIFFLLIGLEVKREILDGELASLPQITLPLAAAGGGMVIPSLIHVGLNWGDTAALAGWAIPAATDIAFALGVLALIGKRVPQNLKLFLLALAIIDDLGAIVVIALFYSSDLSVLSLLLAAGGVAGLFLLNRSGVRSLTPYLLLGAVLWVCVLKSGVHATLAGVVLAFAIPLKIEGIADSPLGRLEHILHPWVAFVILPAFAFANAGISFAGMSFSSVLAPLPLGIAAGLFVGKQIGIFGMSWAAVRLGLARLPQGVTWPAFYGMSVLCGIGFTMSLFIASLALEGGNLSNLVAARAGILLGSLLSALFGYILLRVFLRPSETAVSGQQ